MESLLKFYSKLFRLKHLEEKLPVRLEYWKFGIVFMLREEGDCTWFITFTILPKV